MPIITVMEDQQGRTVLHLDADSVDGKPRVITFNDPQEAYHLATSIVFQTLRQGVRSRAKVDVAQAAPVRQGQPMQGQSVPGQQPAQPRQERQVAEPPLLGDQF